MMVTMVMMLTGGKVISFMNIVVLLNPMNGDGGRDDKGGCNDDGAKDGSSNTSIGIGRGGEDMV